MPTTSGDWALAGQETSHELDQNAQGALVSERSSLLDPVMLEMFVWSDTAWLL